MKRGFVGAILAGVCVVLGVAVAYVSSKQDRTDPVITVSEDALTYTEGEGTEGLLTGVTATDKEDGDLTKDIFVEKVVPISENKAIVYYGVLDKSQNVGTATKEVEYFPAGQQPAEQTPQETAPAAEAAAQPLAPNGERPVIQLTTGTADIPAGCRLIRFHMYRELLMMWIQQMCYLHLLRWKVHMIFPSREVTS